MTCSPAQLAANRANAQKSTGPKTPEGKAQSRANALKHGLCASALIPEDLDLIQERSSDFYRTLKPQNDFQGWLVNKAVVLSIRIDRCERMERRYRERKRHRAELAWDQDRELEIEILGGQLARKPLEVVASLKRTTVGCDWLIGRWKLLEAAANPNGVWTADQARMAFDLLGMPVEFRDDRLPADSDDPAGLARREQARLLEHRAMISEFDEVDRALTEVDLLDESDPELRRLRRYEAALHGRIRWCLKEFRYESPYHRPHPDISSRWSLEYRPEPKLDEPAPPPIPPVPQILTSPAPAPAPPTAPEAKKPPRDPRRMKVFSASAVRPGARGDPRIRRGDQHHGDRHVEA